MYATKTKEAFPSKDLTTKLKEEYPKLYCNLKVVEVGNGWTDLLLALSEWLRRFSVQVIEVKGHNGLLEIQVDGKDKDKVQDIISTYTYLSGAICETCGNTNAKRFEGKTLCLEHK